MLCRRAVPCMLQQERISLASSAFGSCQENTMLGRYLRCAYRHCSIIVGGTYPSGTVYGFGNSPFMLSSAFLRLFT